MNVRERITGWPYPGPTPRVSSQTGGNGAHGQINVGGPKIGRNHVGPASFPLGVVPTRTPVIDPTRWPMPASAEPGSHHHRHALSRRAFMGSMASVAGAAMGVGMLPASVLAAKPSSMPKPTANVFDGTPFHFTGFGPATDPSSIDDFNGFVGVADVQGTGTATNPDGTTETLLFDTDMRFMSGVYVGQDGAVHKGAFRFV